MTVLSRSDRSRSRLKAACVAFGIGCLAVGFGCSALPTVTPLPSDLERERIARACVRAFPQIPWSASHAIDASLPLGNNALFIGVTTMDAVATHSVLMSPEGLVVFDAIATSEKLELQRALPPLDKSDFARGLIADVRQAFARPAQPPDIIGHNAAGAPVCRWHLKEKRTLDVELQGEEPVQIRGYRDTTLEREIHLSEPLGPEVGWFRRVVLRAPGAAGYTLRMRLMDHDGPPAIPKDTPSTPQTQIPIPSNKGAP